MHVPHRTCHRPRRRTLACAALVAAVAWTSTAGAITLDQRCRAALAKAAGKYAGCVQKALAKYYLTVDPAPLSPAAGRCVTKYAAVWPKVQPNCGGPPARFNESGLTVGDRLTGLEWQKKDDSGGVWDKDRTFRLSTAGVSADGTAFNPLPAPVRECFASHCDWRLPSLRELLTILDLSKGACAGPGSDPCIDPIFAPTTAGEYWSATSDASNSSGAWILDFSDGNLYRESKDHDFYVRAVRNGL